jgi:hypothetical protein
MTPDYYTPPDVHHNAIEIEALEVEEQNLKLEYNYLTSESCPWSEDGEARCVEIEERLEEIKGLIDYLYYGDSV